MGLIKDERQLAITRRTISGLKEAVRRIRLKHSGATRKALLAGPEGMIKDLQREVREYGWLRKATREEVAQRWGRATLDQLGPFLARLRIASGLTQVELARRAGCRQPDIARLENQDYRGHTARSLRAVADALGVEITVGAAAKAAERPA